VAKQLTVKLQVSAWLRRIHFDHVCQQAIGWPVKPESAFESTCDKCCTTLNQREVLLSRVLYRVAAAKETAIQLGTLPALFGRTLWQLASLCWLWSMPNFTNLKVTTTSGVCKQANERNPHANTGTYSVKLSERQQTTRPEQVTAAYNRSALPQCKPLHIPAKQSGTQKL